jgi:hypothetical protein
MSCGKVITKFGSGHEFEGTLKCGTMLYHTDGGPKVVRIEVVLCSICREAVRALEEATKP